MIFICPKISQQLTLATAGGVVLGILLLITSCLALFFFCKRRKARNRNMVVKEDINDTYGDYTGPDAVTEITDNNDYYAGDYDYEAGTTETREFNSEYLKIGKA